MIKKIEQIQVDNKININIVDKISKIDININAENLLKKVIEIPILVNYTVSSIDGGGIGG